MTITPAARRQWEVAGRDEETGRITCYQVPFDASILEVFKYSDSTPWRLTYSRSELWLSLNATTPEEAITEAVVAVTQHLNWLLEDLATIPTTLPPTT